MRRYFALLLTCSSLMSVAQPTLSRYRKVDLFASTVHYKGDLQKLTVELTAPYRDDLSKVRSIFSWITDNISYDVRLYNHPREPRPLKCGKNEDCKQVLIEWQKKYVRKVLKRGKAICGGYALLFQQMCAAAGIRAEVIEGYAKRRPYEVGTIGPLDHAWNAVYVDSAWHLHRLTTFPGIISPRVRPGS